MVFDLELPCPRNIATFQVWDRDLFTANDLMGEASFTFEKEAKIAWEDHVRVRRYGKGEGLTDRVMNKKTEKFWLSLLKRTEDGGFAKCG